MKAFVSFDYYGAAGTHKSLSKYATTIEYGMMDVLFDEIAKIIRANQLWKIVNINIRIKS